MKTMPAYSSHTALTSVIKTKEYQEKWYRELANRFRSFDTHTSCLFANLAEEHEQNKQALLKLARHIMGDEVTILLAKNRNDKNNIVFYEIVSYQDSTNHFFVINEQMAMVIFDAVLESGRQAQRFYETCFIAENHYFLRTQYQRLSQVEDQHVQRLEEAKERYHTESAHHAPWLQPRNTRYIDKNCSLTD